jgi:cytoskeletal protein RodZ
VNSIGKKLAQQRKKKGLSVEDAARVTKIRPERIVDLEGDDYSRFPNSAYAKSFLLLYGKFLGVDVSDSAEAFGDTRGKMRVEEYEYLSNAPTPRVRPIRPARKKRSIRPLIVAAAAFTIALVFLYSVLNFQRLGNLSELAERSVGNPDSRAKNIVLQEAKLEPSPAVAAQPAAMISPPEVKQLSIRPTKKIWVKIRKDSPDSTPIFEDWLYPDARPLTVRGVRFWIEAQEKDALEIRSDGEVISTEDSLVKIE